MIKVVPVTMLFVFLCLSSFGQSLSGIEQFSAISAQNEINAIAVDQKNNKYLATDLGLFMINGTTQEVESDFVGRKVKALAMNRQSGIWAAVDSNEIVNIETGHQIFLDGDGLRITSMDATNSQIWVGTNQGVHLVSLRQDGTIRKYTPKNSALISPQINVIYVDRLNVRWIGTDKGIVRIEDDQWKLYEKRSKITAITYTSEGTWIASDKELWLVDQWNRWAPAAVDRGLSRGTVRALAADRKGNIYLASDILVQFNPYKDASSTLDETYGFAGTKSISLVCDEDNQVWVGTASRGLFSIDISEDKNRKLTAIIILEKVPDCYGASNAALVVKVAGGVPPYRFNWQNEGLSGDRPGNLKAGKYALVIEDSNGNTYPVEAEIRDPDPLQIDFIRNESVSRNGRKDGIAEISISGGSKPYRASWDNKIEGTINSRLSAGNHTVTVTDINGCREQAFVTIGDARLMPQLADVESLNIGQTVKIEQLFFEADSSEIIETSYPILDEIYDFLSSNAEVVIEVGGHTNNIPPHQYCDRLSTERAQSVAFYLYEKGISETRISFKGYGKRQPIATNQTRAGRQKNQRVEVKIVSLGAGND
jgi:outer membrane protein OmpA-like peptidoglycan-associated protein